MLLLPGVSIKPICNHCVAFSLFDLFTFFIIKISSRQGLLGKPKTSIEALTDTLEELEMDDKARNRIKVFLNQKEKIGELRDEDLEKLGELGSGNGGVVMKGQFFFVLFLHSMSVEYRKPFSLSYIL